MVKNKETQLQNLLSRELDPAFARRARILVRGLAITGKETVLEIGCGRGFYEGLLSKLYPDLSLTAIDLNQQYLDVARRSVPSKNVTFAKESALDLPWKKNTFGRVFATEVLEHLPDDEKGLSEMYRVLKPGGIAVVTVPYKHYPFIWDPLNWTLEHLFHTHVNKDIWWLAGIWADHVRLYDTNDLQNKAEQAGFEVKECVLSTHSSIPFAHFLLYGIGKNIVEAGLFKDMYRFSFETNPGLLLRTIQRFTYLVDGKNSDLGEKKSTSAVNCIVILKKT